MAKIIWTDGSLRWLKEIGDYVAKDSPEAACRIMEGIYDKVQLLASHPRIGFRYAQITDREVRVCRQPRGVKWWCCHLSHRSVVGMIREFRRSRAAASPSAAKRGSFGPTHRLAVTLSPRHLRRAAATIGQRFDSKDRSAAAAA